MFRTVVVLIESFSLGGCVFFGVGFSFFFGAFVVVFRGGSLGVGGFRF